MVGSKLPVSTARHVRYFDVSHRPIILSTLAPSSLRIHLDLFRLQALSAVGRITLPRGSEQHFKGGLRSFEVCIADASSRTLVLNVQFAEAGGSKILATKPNIDLTCNLLPISGAWFGGPRKKLLLIPPALQGRACCTADLKP